MRELYWKPGSKTREIIRLWKQNTPRAAIARMVGCSISNVTQTVRRHLMWDNRIETLSKEHHEWLVRQASAAYTTPSVMARALLIDAIEEAMEKEKAA